MRKCKVASEEILFEKNTNQWKSVCCTASSFLSSLPLPCRRSVLKQWARQCRRHHHPHRRHHHPYHRHKDLHQLESTSSGFPDWLNALRTLLPSCWRQPRCCVSLSFSSFLSSFRSSYCNSIIFRWLNLENLASKVDAAVSLLWTKVLPLNSSFLNPFRRRSHVVIQSSPGGCPTCQPPSSPTIGATISAQLHLPGDCVVINDGRRRWQCQWLSQCCTDGMILSLTTFFLHPHRTFSSKGRQPSLSQVRGPWDLGLLCLSADHPDFVRQVLTSNSILTVFKILSLGC